MEGAEAKSLTRRRSNRQNKYAIAPKLSSSTPGKQIKVQRYPIKLRMILSLKNGFNLQKICPFISTSMPELDFAMHFHFHCVESAITPTLSILPPPSIRQKPSLIAVSPSNGDQLV